VLTDDDLPRLFWAIAGEAIRPSVHTAPPVIVSLACKRIYIDAYIQKDPSWADANRIPMPFWQLDTAIPALLILLTAVNEDLGAVYFGLVDHETPTLRTEFGIPDHREPIGASAIGHDAETERTSLGSRCRPLTEIFPYGQW
jgi:Nitroreductase family